MALEDYEMEDNEARNDWALPDARLLTEQQRQELCRMLFNALLEIRGLGSQGKAQQAADLADAFHNLPIYLRNFLTLKERTFLPRFSTRQGAPIRLVSQHDALA